MTSPSRPRPPRRPSDQRHRHRSSTREDLPSPASTPKRKKRPRPAAVESGTDDERTYLRGGGIESPIDSPRDSPRRKTREGEPSRDSPRRHGEGDRDRDRRRSKGGTVRVEKSRGPPPSTYDGRDRRKTHKAASSSASQLLSEDALKMLDHVNEKGDDFTAVKPSRPKVKEKTRALGSSIVERIRVDERRKRKKKRRRMASGPVLEEGGLRRERRRTTRFGKKFCKSVQLVSRFTDSTQGSVWEFLLLF